MLSTYSLLTLLCLWTHIHSHQFLVPGSKSPDAHHNVSNVDNRRSGYLHSTIVNANNDNDARFSPSSGFVPIAKPLVQDIFEASSSDRNNVQHSPQTNQQQASNSFNASSDNYDESNYDNGGNGHFSRYPSSFDSGYQNSASMDQMYDETQNRPEASDGNNNNFKPQGMLDSDITKYFSEKYNTRANDDKNADHQHHHGDLQQQLDTYNNNMKNHRAHPKQQKYSSYSDESSMMNPASAIQMMKNMSPYASGDSQPSESDMQGLMSQFTSSSVDPSSGSKLSNAEFASSNDFGSFGNDALSPPNQMSDMNGIAGFQPAPEGGQLPAPPGYKHVGYITIPAGATNLPNMMGQPSNGLPIIRPIPINGVDMAGYNKNKLDAKKNQDNKMSESKPVRSFLSRLNPLNMLRRLRQRRERRHTSDMSSGDYMTMPGKYASSYGYAGGSPSYSMSPYSGSTYSSLLGLGGMSGVGMYSSSPSMYTMPSYGSYSPYAGYSSYASPAYGYMSPASSYMSSADVKGSGSEMTASASALSPTGMAMSPQGSMGMSMPMMMPMSSYGGYGGMSAMPSYGSPSYGSPMHAMPYGYAPHAPHMHAPHYHPYSSGSSQGSQSSSSDSSAGQTQLPGGINLSDLLKDEEDEPSKFRKFLGYMNPMNIFKKFRNNTSDDQKRLSRFRRDASSLFDVSSANDTELSDDVHHHRQDDMDGTLKADNNTSSNLKDDDTDSMEEEMSADDTSHKAVHKYRKILKRTKANLMGSRNYEVLRGGAFQADRLYPLQSESMGQYDEEQAGSSISGTEMDNSFHNDKPSLRGFQGFDSFPSSLYGNTLSASNKLANFVEQDTPAKKSAGGFESIEQASITSTDLKAVS